MRVHSCGGMCGYRPRLAAARLLPKSSQEPKTVGGMRVSGYLAKCKSANPRQIRRRSTAVTGSGPDTGLGSDAAGYSLYIVYAGRAM